MKTVWQIKKLGNVCEVTTGNSNTVDAVRDGQYAFFDRSKIIKRSNRFLFDSEALIIPGEGAEFFPKYYSGKFDLHQRAYALLNFDKETDIKFVEYFLIFEHKYFERVAVGATAKSLRRRHFLDFEIPLPTIVEQRRIVNKLDEIFKHIVIAKENAEKNLRNAKELFESYLYDIFTNHDWDEKTLGEIATFRNGMNFTKGSRGEVIQIVGVRDFQKKFWVPFGNLESVTIDGKLSEIDLLRKGDILTVRSNGNPELIGRTLLSDDVIGKVSHSGFTIRIRINSGDIYPTYLCHYLKSQKARNELVASGTGVNIKSLNQQALTKLFVPLPRLLEQKTIAKKLDALSDQTKKLEAIYKQKIADLDELKKSILKEAFSGKL